LQSESKPQRQLSKEFLRQWLIENGFQGKEGQQIPHMSPELVVAYRINVANFPFVKFRLTWKIKVSFFDSSHLANGSSYS